MGHIHPTGTFADLLRKVIDAFGRKTKGTTTVWSWDVWPGRVMRQRSSHTFLTMISMGSTRLGAEKLNWLLCQEIPRDTACTPVTSTDRLPSHMLALST